MKKRVGKNRGFSLVELVVVIAISAILITLITFSLSLVKGADAQNTAKRLEHLIKTTRMQALTKGADEGVMTLSLEGGAYYVTIGTGAKEFLCSQQSITISGATSVQEATNFTPISSTVIEFRTSGKMATYGTETRYCKFILDSKGKDYEIVIYPETGSVSYRLR